MPSFSSENKISENQFFHIEKMIVKYYGQIFKRIGNLNSKENIAKLIRFAFIITGYTAQL